MNNKKPVVMLSFLVVAGLSVTMLFQNCQQSKVVQAKSTATTAASNTGGSLPLSTDQSTSSYASSTQSDAVASDCSSSQAFFQTTVVNIGSDALFCIEYQLDMPAGNARVGEANYCDSASKFRASSWPYSVANRSFTSPVIYTRNHATYVPGTFTIVVKDNQGAIYRSNPIVIKRSGYADCKVTTAAAPSQPTYNIPTGTCGWAPGTIFSPAPSNLQPYMPTYACTTSIKGQLASSSVGTFKCVCN